MAHTDVIGATAQSRRDALQALLASRRDRLAGTHPASAGQRALWMFDQLHPGSPAYNLSFVARATGGVDVAAMRTALRYVVDRHAALRTTLAEIQGELRQRVGDGDDFEFAEFDLRGRPAAELDRLIEERTMRPFDLGADVLLRGDVIHLDGDEELLLIHFHHIASDLWSFGVITRDLAAAYPAACAGTPLRATPPPTDYVDYVRHQREVEQSPRHAAAREYWDRQLAGEIPRLDLPSDRQRPARASHRAAVHAFKLDRAATGRLKNLAREENATLYAATLASFALALSRQSGQRDVWLGSVTSGRTRPEFNEVVGYFANPTVIRVGLDRGQTFRDLLGSVRDCVLDSLEHEDYAFSHVLEQTSDKRGGVASLFDASCYFESSPWSDLGAISLFGTGFGDAEIPLGDLTLHSYAQSATGSEQDFALFVEEAGGELCCSLRYATDLFDAESVAALAERMALLTRRCLDAPDEPHGLLSPMSEEEAARVLHTWNRPDDGVAGEFDCLHHLILDQARRTPTLVAVESEDASLTYAELVERATALSRVLRSRGVGPEVKVGLSVDGSCNLMVAILAVLIAGGAYVPMDPGYPVKRLEYMMADSAVALLLTESALLDRLPLPDAPVLLLDEEHEAPADLPEAVEPRADNLAYVIYTSGSTGRPKGVMVEHRGLVDLDLAHREAFPPEPGRRILQNASISFDVSTWEWVMALTTGSTLCVTPREQLRPGPPLIETVRRRQISALSVTPSVLATMKSEDLPTVRELTSVGEAISAQLVGEWVAGRRIVNAYGPTEITVFGTYEDCVADGITPPIGVVFAATEAYVLDENLQPVPVGVLGELYLGGSGVTRGYQNRGDLTADRFVPHPFSPRPGDRLYRTGDRVRRAPDGRLHYLGRADHQVKIRGVRTEPGEIQGCLLEHPGVHEALVFARPGRNGELQLVGYVVLTEAARGTLGPADLRSFLTERLTPNMVPSFLTILDAFPLNPNGKTDRTQLPEPDETADAAPAEQHLDPVEHAVAQIWSSVLGVERVSGGDDFFESGGHSLSATRLVAGVTSVLGIKLPLRDVFDQRSFRQLVARIRELVAAQDGAAESAPIPVAPRGEHGLPLSFAQLRLWFLEQLRPGNLAYRIAGELHLDGPLDLPALRAAFADVLDRHEVLRTTYQVVDGEPRQIVLAAPENALAELSVAPGGDWRAETDLVIGRPFDLTASPVRACLTAVAEDRHVLSLALHHIAGDGWSMRVLVRDLAAAYSAFAAGGRPQFPRPQVQYGDFAVWQRERLDGAEGARVLEYWERRLEGCATVLDLPTDRPAAELAERPARSVARRLAPIGWKSVNDLAARLGATPAIVLTAAYGLLLGRWSGQTDLLVGMPVAGRDRPEVENTVGLFVNTVVVRLDLAAEQEFETLVEQVRRTTLEAQANQELPFERIVDRLVPNRDLTRTPLVQVLFNMLNLDEFEARFAGLETQLAEIEDVSARFDLTLYAKPDRNGLDLKLVYDTNLYDESTVAELLDQFDGLLDALVTEPSRQLREAAQPASELLPDLAAPLSAAAGPAVHLRFLEQARQTPDAVAVSFGADTFTYRELAARVHGLARTLRGADAGPGAMVAVDGVRGLNLIVGLLAVLHTGSAFTVFDRSWPTARREQLLGSVRPHIWLSTGLAPDLDPTVLPLVIITAEQVESVAEQAKSAAEQPESQDGPEPSALAADPAYLMITSGTTGRPKLVSGAHAPLAHFTDWYARTFDISADDRFALASGLAHDPLLRDALVPLALGASVVVPPAETLVAPELYGRWFAENRVTVWHTTPPTARFLAGLPDGALSALRLVAFGGDVLTGREVAVIRRLAPSARIVAFYGATETPQAHGWYEVDGVPSAQERVPLGRGIDDTQLLVLRGSQQAAIGELGEVVVRSAYLASGYRDDADATAAAFRPDPAGAAGVRLYRTGDLGRYRADGSVAFHGRADRQVKVRGHRIDPLEIERVLLACAGVTAAHVLPVPDDAGETDLAAYYAGPADPAGVRAYLQSHLPASWVPRTVSGLPALPLTANGKVDAAALRKARPAAEPRPAGAGLSPPAGLEARIAAAWRAVLNVEEIGREQNFFELGGHSMLMVRLSERLRGDLGREVGVVELFRYPTIAALAAALDQTRGPAAAPAPAGPSARQRAQRVTDRRRRLKEEHDNAR